MEMVNTKRTLFWLWVTLALVILFTLLLFNQSHARDDVFYDNLSSREKYVARKMERKYLGADKSSVLRFEGDAEIEEDELIDADVIILKGTLKIDGQVDGTVLAIFGDVELGSTAYVRGDVVSVNGKVWTEDETKIRGDVVVTNVPVEDEDDDVIISRRPYGDQQDRSRDKNWPDDDDEIAWADHNRVDGITLGMQFPRPGWWANKNHNFAIIGKAGYSFASKRWQYQAGIERWTAGDYRFSIGGEFHDLTDTQDRWIICDHENALAAFFLKEDFRDYYNRSGWSVWASQNFSKSTKLTATYHYDDFRNMEKRTNWSLFGKGKHFRENPLALPYGFVQVNGYDAPLTIKSISGTFTIDSRNNMKRPTSGWFINAFGEYAGKELDNLYQFERYIIDIANYFPLSWDEHISARLRVASSRGLLPPMYWYDLGGISTLRGLNHKEMTGDRMVLGNVEYHLRSGDGNFLGVDIILFVDSGLAWFADENMPEYANSYPVDETIQQLAYETRPEDTFEKLSWSSLRTNVGIAIASPDGDFRVNFAKRIDVGGQDVIVTFRLCKPF
ncbi:BamA/TamA family outer membrane protein [candidate division KSB1 bacterium]|nr:BamA/TamA family outer membrane protein [candidate division KSB1 bacterium]